MYPTNPTEPDSQTYYFHDFHIDKQNRRENAQPKRFNVDVIEMIVFVSCFHTIVNSQGRRNESKVKPKSLRESALARWRGCQGNNEIMEKQAAATVES